MQLGWASPTIEQQSKPYAVGDASSPGCNKPIAPVQRHEHTLSKRVRGNSASPYKLGVIYVAMFSILRHGSGGYIHPRKLRDGLKQLLAMVPSKSEPFYFECVYNRHGRFGYRPALLHLPERGKSRMHIIRDMFGPGHSPLVSGAFFVL